MDIKRRGAGAVGRWDYHITADVQEYSQVDKTEDQVATVRRVAVVSSTGCVFAALLDHLPCVGPLREVSAFFPLEPFAILTIAAFSMSKEIRSGPNQP